jgi:hypothetical protein
MRHRARSSFGGMPLRRLFFFAYGRLGAILIDMFLSRQLSELSSYRILRRARAEKHQRNAAV